jgi:hypothetical protein
LILGTQPVLRLGTEFRSRRTVVPKPPISAKKP